MDNKKLEIIKKAIEDIILSQIQYGFVRNSRHEAAHILFRLKQLDK